MLQRDVDFHNNIIRFYGIAKLEPGMMKLSSNSIKFVKKN